MTTIAQRRAEMNALAITVAVETQLFRWAAEVDRLKALNAKLVEALEEALAEIECLSDEHGTSWEWATEVEQKVNSALDSAKGEAEGEWKGRPFKFPGDA